MILDKSKWSAAWFHYMSIALKLAYDRNKLFKTLHYWFRDLLSFDFLDKGLRIVSLAYFVYDFSTRTFLMLYSINWPNFIAWLPLLVEIWVSLKPPTNRPPSTDHLPTNQPTPYHSPSTNRSTTTCTDHWPTNHRPVRSLSTTKKLNSYLT